MNREKFYFYLLLLFCDVFDCRIRTMASSNPLQKLVQALQLERVRFREAEEHADSWGEYSPLYQLIDQNMMGLGF